MGDKEREPRDIKERTFSFALDIVHQGSDRRVIEGPVRCGLFQSRYFQA